MKTILVTGAYGQLGNEIKDLVSFLPQAEFIFSDVDTLDICNKESLTEYFNKHNLDFVVNCAAYTAVDKAESDQEKANMINAMAVKFLAEVCSQNKVKLIQVSTDYVFDGTQSTPYIETDKTNPQSSYGRSKLDGELALKDNENAIIIRTAWLYSKYGNNIVKTIRKKGSELGQLKFVFDQVGSPTWAHDLATAIIEILKLSIENEKNFKPGIYHYSNEGVCSWYDFAQEVVRISNINCKVLPILTSEYPVPAKRPAYSVFDKSKIKNSYNISIPWWKDSLANCIKEME
ncbi:MAG TPA: dTDP-4-dehydrorhamnose reductase [Bacteroidales bacterium]|nr:dTDP-4-dehydrorhamnose reductase [Bacteroidales bacterium]